MTGVQTCALPISGFFEPITPLALNVAIAGRNIPVRWKLTDFNNAPLLDACGRGSCMDYTNNPNNQGTPNQHDYDQLVTIYSHTDSYTTLAAGLPLASASEVDDVDNENQADWGRTVGFLRGRANQFERDLGNGHKMITFVLWAE